MLVAELRVRGFQTDYQSAPAPRMKLFHSARTALDVAVADVQEERFVFSVRLWAEKSGLLVLILLMVVPWRGFNPYAVRTKHPRALTAAVSRLDEISQSVAGPRSLNFQGRKNRPDPGQQSGHQSCLDLLLPQHGPKGRRGVLVLLQNSHQAGTLWLAACQVNLRRPAIAQFAIEIIDIEMHVMLNRADHEVLRQLRHSI